MNLILFGHLTHCLIKIHTRSRHTGQGQAHRVTAARLHERQPETG